MLTPDSTPVLTFPPHHERESSAIGNVEKEPLRVPRRADLFVALLRLSQQLRARHVVAEHGGQLGAPLAERGRERLRSGAFDQRGGGGERGFGGVARGRLRRGGGARGR